MKNDERANELLHDGSSQKKLKGYFPVEDVSFSNEYCKTTLDKAINFIRLLGQKKELIYKDKLYIASLYNLTREQNNQSTISYFIKQIETFYLEIYHNSNYPIFDYCPESYLSTDLNYYKRLITKFIGYATMLPKNAWEINRLQFKITKIILVADKKDRCNKAIMKISKLKENDISIDIVFENLNINDKFIQLRILKKVKIILENISKGIDKKEKNKYKKNNQPQENN